MPSTFVQIMRGGWNVVEAMMEKKTQFSASYEDVEDFEKRRVEARKKLKQEGALESKKTPRRNTARSASQWRTSRKRSPSSSPQMCLHEASGA